MNFSIIYRGKLQLNALQYLQLNSRIQINSGANPTIAAPTAKAIAGLTNIDNKPSSPFNNKTIHPYMKFVNLKFIALELNKSGTTFFCYSICFFLLSS